MPHGLQTHAIATDWHASWLEMWRHAQTADDRNGLVVQFAQSFRKNGYIRRMKHNLRVCRPGIVNGVAMCSRDRAFLLTMAEVFAGRKPERRLKTR